MQLVSSFQARLKEGMAKRNINATQLCKLTGIGKSLMSFYMNGKHKANANNVYHISRALHVSEAWLIGYDVPMEEPHAVEINQSSVSSELYFLIDSLDESQKEKTIQFIKNFILK